MTSTCLMSMTAEQIDLRNNGRPRLCEMLNHQYMQYGAGPAGSCTEHHCTVKAAYSCTL
jgi:hypothetical protein